MSVYHRLLLCLGPQILDRSLAQVGAGLKFECTQEQGAFVFVDQPADRSQIQSSRSIIPYLKANIEHWNALALRLDLDVAREPLLFVSGTVKTNDWGLGAFLTHGQSCVAEFEAQVPFAQAKLTWRTSTQSVGNTEVRQRSAAEIQHIQELAAIESNEDPSASRQSLDSVRSFHQNKDQTLFLHYYKVKKRLWFNRVIKAAAGPHELDPDSSGEGDGPLVRASSEELEVVDEPHISPVRLVRRRLSLVADG